MRKLSALTDAQLLERSHEDPQAFAAFYRRHLPVVLRFVLGRVGDRELSADLTAEVFAAALLARRSFDPARGHARAWLCTIAANKIADSLRRGRVEDACRRRLQMAPVGFDDDDLGRVEERADAGSAVGNLEELFAGLPADTRAVLEARVVDDRDYAEIAAQLGCSESVVRQRVSRGLARLRLQLTGKT
jgi:RNA polymerase sigma-70 factor (ECF subfamily)